jgi:hypothetical protein
VQLFQSFFCAQLIATLKWQPAQLSATCEWHNQHNFCTKKHGEICFKKTGSFFVFWVKKICIKILMKLMPAQAKLNTVTMDKLKLTGRALGRVYNFRSGCMCTIHLLLGVAIQPNLELKTQPKLVLGSLPLAFTLPAVTSSDPSIDI